MIKGATIFAFGSACGLVVGTIFGVIVGLTHGPSAVREEEIKSGL